MKVPVYERQVQQREDLISPNESSAPNPNSFGTDVAEGLTKIGQAGQGLGDALAKHFVEKQKQLDEQTALAADTKFRQELNNQLYSTEADKNGVPQGFMNRRETQAAGITPQFDQTFSTLSQKYLGLAQNDNQKALISKFLTTHFEDARTTIIKHEAEQGRAAYDSSLDANIKQRVQDAGAIDRPDAMANAIDQAKQIQALGLKRKGAPDDVIAMNNQQLAGDMVKAPFELLLNQDYRKAKDLLEGVRDKIPASVAAGFDKALEGKKLDDLQTGVWNHVSSFTLSDGKPDEAKMQAAVNAMDLPQDKRDKVWEYVKLRSGEQVKQQKMQDDARDNDFSNAILTAKKQGKTVDDVLKTVPNWGGDQTTQHGREEVVKKLYTTDIKTDPYTFVQLFGDVHDGKAGSLEINQAFTQGKISGTDYRSLMEAKYNTSHKDDQFLQKEMVDHLKEMAHEQFGSDKKKANNFIYSVLTNVRGKSPEETYNYANQILKKDPASGYFSFTQDQQWQTNLKLTDAQNQMMGQYHEDFGKDQVRAIGQGALFSGKKTWGVEDVDSFAKALGGPDSIKVGTPANNAIQSLIQKRKAVTVDSVKAVLGQHPDGVWR